MAEDNSVNVDEPEIQYILNNTEFVFDPSELNEEINDIIYTDGNQAYILNGHILQTVSDTLLVQDEEETSQYLVNDDQDKSSEDQQFFQCMDEEGNISEASNILYINEDGISLSAQDISSQLQVAELMHTVPNLFDENQETVNITDMENDIGEQDMNDFIDINDTNWYQYFVSKDGNIHITIPPINNNENTANTNNIHQKVDLTAITGKNLLTGQVVTLESYMDKILNRMKSGTSIKSLRRKHNLNAFLNKKLNLGLTVGGKKLMAKIVHVGTKKEDDELTDNDLKIDSGEPLSTVSPSNIFEDNNLTANNESQIQLKFLSKESDQFQYILKILSDLMTKENFKKRIKEKSLQIKVVEKYRTCVNVNTKHISYISGYMESKLIPVENSEYVEDWNFIPDCVPTGVGAKLESQEIYSNILYLTIITTYYKNNKSIVRVIIDAKNIDCRYCEQVFGSKENMISHLNEQHNTCEVCNGIYNNVTELMVHKQIHNNGSEIKVCQKNNCKKYFMTDEALKKHKDTHRLEPFKCSLCSYSGVNEEDFRAHSLSHPTNCDICSIVFVNQAELATHKKQFHSSSETRTTKKEMITKIYVCEICKHTFSRQANLHRHAEIHKKSDKLFTCTICGCSYHFSSSLTRHMVQNHIQLQRPNLASSEEGNLDKLML